MITKYGIQTSLIVLCAVMMLSFLSGVAGAAFPAAADGNWVRVPKQVSLIVEPQRLLASNVRLGRIDPQALQAGEQVITQAEARAVVVAVTDRRILAYGPVIGWREQPLEEGEVVESVRAEDFAVFIITSSRYVNFNADSGIWGSESRPAN